MALTNDQITAQNFKDFYGQIRPYLNGQVPTFANQFSRSDLYSTDEKIIGQWIDGKPLYQKTLYVNLQDTSDGPHTVSDLTTSCIDTFINCLGYINHSGEVMTNNNFFYSSAWTSSFFTRYDLTSKSLIITTKNFGGNTLVGYVTIQYTKTTDSAIKVGTGTDYSTDEQIIGTWIDGKPLYQKTFSGTVSSANNISYVSIGASVDTFADGRGVLNNSVPLIGVTNESVSAGVSIFVNTNSAASNKNTFGIYSKPESQSAWVGKPYYLTLCYTKTTD